MEGVRRPNQSDWTAWADGYEWNVTGTLNFIPNRKPTLDEAIRQWRSFWNIIDRNVYGKSYKQVKRIPRFTCIHRGGNGDNPHLQFVTLSPIDPKPFCIALNAIWANFPLAAPPSENSITPTISTERSINYGGHEHWVQGAETYATNIMHLPEELAEPRCDALEKLNAIAKPIWLTRAALAFPAHVQKACDDYNRRHNKV